MAWLANANSKKKHPSMAINDCAWRAMMLCMAGKLVSFSSCNMSPRSFLALIFSSSYPGGNVGALLSNLPSAIHSS
eukprot:12891857-Prorocentrum_lima.AAC.1